MTNFLQHVFFLLFLRGLRFFRYFRSGGSITIHGVNKEKTAITPPGIQNLKDDYDCFKNVITKLGPKTAPRLTPIIFNATILP